MKVRGIIAAILMIILIAVPTVAASANYDNTAVVASEEEIAPLSDFTPRLKAPSKSNSYYYSNKNIFYSIGYGMPNCTAYAWGRAYELLGTKPKLSVDSAHYWWDYNKSNNYYPYGSTPKLGAIACWDNPYGGHVAVVEKITSTTVTLSHSEWAGRTFYLTEYAKGASNGGVSSSGWKFKGYIYILDGEILPEGDIYRIDSSDGVNMRKGAGTSYSRLTAIPHGEEIVVTETKKADGYTWGKTTYDGYTGWCVLDYATLIYKKPDVKPTVPPTEPPTEAPTEAPTEVPTEPATETPDEVLPDFGVRPPSAFPTETPTEFPTETPTVLPSQPATSPLWADINGDGKTSISDATILQKFISGMKVVVNNECTDTNGDGKVSVHDATYIQKTLASL